MDEIVTIQELQILQMRYDTGFLSEETPLELTGDEARVCEHRHILFRQEQDALLEDALDLLGIPWIRKTRG